MRNNAKDRRPKPGHVFQAFQMSHTFQMFAMFEAFLLFAMFTVFAAFPLTRDAHKKTEHQEMRDSEVGMRNFVSEAHVSKGSSSNSESGIRNSL